MKTILVGWALLLVVACSNAGEEASNPSSGRSCLPTPNTLEQPPAQGLPCSLIPPGLDLAE